MTFWRRWVQRPQELFLRKVVFQIHLWTGIGLGVYVLVICVSGSVLVYRNELYRTFSPKPMIVAGSGNPMTVADLKSAASRAYPGYEVADVRAGETPNHAVEITLKRGNKMRRRLLSPFTAKDLGDPVPAGFRFTAWLLNLHDNLLGGETGRRINGIGALFVTLISVTGAIIWWPGSKSWRRSLTLDHRGNWKRLNWSLHSALGFWAFAFVTLWGVSGIYFVYPDQFTGALSLDPAGWATFWLAQLHFGRFSWLTEVMWAVTGLVPAVLAFTGVFICCRRVVFQKPSNPKVIVN